VTETENGLYPEYVPPEEQSSLRLIKCWNCEKVNAVRTKTVENPLIPSPLAIARAKLLKLRRAVFSLAFHHEGVSKEEIIQSVS